MTPTPTFEERLAALEASHIALGDLPLAALQRKLELDWRPAASVLLGDASITPGMLPFKYTFGKLTLTFTASTDSAVVTKAHGLGVTPVAVIIGSAFLSGVVSVKSYSEIATYSDTTFKAFGKADASWTGSIDVPWVALG